MLHLVLVLCAFVQTAESPALSQAELSSAAAVSGLRFTPAELELMLADVTGRLREFERLRAVPLENSDPPALEFQPEFAGWRARPRSLDPAKVEYPEVERPADIEELAFADITTLAALVRSRKVSCLELTELFLARLERYDGALHCVVSLTPERARRQAKALDKELDAGRWRGPLHGIPWGAKDLLAVRGTKTTWGAQPFREQVLDVDATVVQRLDEAGAVLIGKLSLGALAWGDVWFGGTTRNPWNPVQGSSGSSAGSASATAAGLVPFAIGTETLGSIVSPSDRCGCSSLRPTFGRVSRHGAMSLSWSMDKLGPIARSMRDAGLVFEAIHGADGRDTTVAEREPFRWPGTVDVTDWVVGVPKGAAEQGGAAFEAALEVLEGLGVRILEVELPEYPLDALLMVLSAEAATAFDELTRSGQDDELTRQIARAWPNTFRAARLIPAVEYLRAQRLRVKMMREFDDVLSGVDALVHPSFAAGVLSMTNLTGHPAAVMPVGFRDDGTPYSISFTGRLFGEERLMALAHRFQEATDHHLRHPVLPAAPPAGDTTGGKR